MMLKANEAEISALDRFLPNRTQIRTESASRRTDISKVVALYPGLKKRDWYSRESERPSTTAAKSATDRQRDSGLFNL